MWSELSLVVSCCSHLIMFQLVFLLFLSPLISSCSCHVYHHMSTAMGTSQASFEGQHPIHWLPIVTNDQTPTTNSHKTIDDTSAQFSLPKKASNATSLCWILPMVICCIVGLAVASVASSLMDFADGDMLEQHCWGDCEGLIGRHTPSLQPFQIGRGAGMMTATLSSHTAVL